MTPDAQPLMLLGGGGHAAVVAEAARLAGYAVAGVYDDAKAPVATLGTSPVPYLGTLQSLLDGDLSPSSPWLLCVGDCQIRRSCLDRLASGLAATIIHPTAFVSPAATVGPGVFVGPLALVHTGARIDAHAIINSAAVVEHHCHIGENTHIAPHVTLGGNVSVGPDTLVGLGAIVLPGVRIGAGCVIGAGAVVRESVPDAARVAGNPARPLPRPVVH